MYIHQTYCISPQQDLLQDDIELIDEVADKKLLAIEPSYEKIPPGILRRMGKSIRMGVGAALPLMAETSEINGIIIGSANAGMDDCVKFLNQIVQYEEGQLTPGSFVQSTGNVIAGQLALISKNKGSTGDDSEQKMRTYSLSRYIAKPAVECFRLFRTQSTLLIHYKKYC